ncbi:hypothetical protein [Parasitella parasitica]|uniref:HSF-type DNA-binding domain-containing protein n=1 Tax=Parasitella parasitica TaxID=35722 RepID=A0A0B7NQ28_9FUNG|nr:hypothetical protein [Parasitella parasitica]
MDYPLAYTDSRQDQSSNVTPATANYRTYPMFNERSDIPSIMFDNNSSNAEDEDSRSSMVLLSTRPHSIHDPWNQPQMRPSHHQQQQQHILNNNYAQHQPIHHQQIHHPAPHSERGIANFVSKLYQCLQSVDNNPKYARWCHHEGKDMFIIDCIPEFTQFVLPRYFKHYKESCRWYHPCFRPDRGDLFHLIRRKATRYSRKRKVRAPNEEDPETILNLGSADESELDEENQENMILIVSNDGRRSSSVSSATQSLQPIDYDSTSSQLQLDFPEPVTVTKTTITTTTSANSPRIMVPAAIPLTVDTNNNMPATNEYHTMATPTLAHSANSSHMLQQDDLPSSDNADDRIIDDGLIVNMQQRQQQVQQQQQQQHFDQQQQQQQQQQQLHQPLMRGQELRLQLYHMKQHYEKMHTYFKEQLNSAQIQIDEQQIRIQQLEGALGITTQSVKQSTIQQPAVGGFMSTVGTTMSNTSSSPFNNVNYSTQAQRQLNKNSPVNTPTNHRAMYQMQSNNITTNGSAITTTPRPSNFYFHENPTSSSPSIVTAGNTASNTDVDSPNNPKVIAQIKNEILSSPSTPSTSSNNWLPYHRDSLSSVAIDSPNSSSTIGVLVTAGSDTNQSISTGTDNAQLKSALPSSTALPIPSLNVHSNINNNSSNSNDHHNNNKVDFMNFNTFI